VFREAGDHSLDAFTRDFSEDDGEDPLHYHSVVRIRSTPLSGLVRMSRPSELPAAPTIVSVKKALVDSELSPTLTLRAGEYYCRYYYLDSAGGIRGTCYSITEEEPADLATLGASA
jgi:hypothetical protein